MCVFLCMTELISDSNTNTDSSATLEDVVNSCGPLVREEFTSVSPAQLLACYGEI